MNAKMMITSVHNERVKRLVALQQKSQLRRECGIVVVEGRRELMHCVNAGHEVVAVYHCPELTPDLPSLLTPHSSPLTPHPSPLTPDSSPLTPHPSPLTPDPSTLTPPCYEVTREVYEKIAYRGSTEGVLAEVRPHPLTLSDLHLPEHPLVMVLEAVEKPGNLGAVLRSADAAPADAVVVCDPLTDLYNPNIIRSSIGAIFTVPCVACSSEECIQYLKSHNIQILTAQLQDSHPYYATDMHRGTAIVMGTESTGLTQVWRDAADAHIRIPMRGRLDSLNVSVSAAILLFEAVRQREQ
ncbi:MAG: RNA methyltransferase [Muribaculaceae bacterium]|nr:RNA methyltransferase [Muribaculaceae bacterium]